MNNQIFKVAAYARVSTLLGQDPKLQIINIREYCAQSKYTVVEEYIDLGLSGKNEQRPQLLKLIESVKQGKFDAVITVGLDRISRSTKHFLTILDLLEQNNTPLISLREQLDFTTATGRLVASVLAAVGSLESSLIAERVRTSMKAKKLLAQQTGNGWRCGRPPLAAELGLQIKNLRSQGKSIRQIAKLLSIGKTSVERALKTPPVGTPV